MEKVKLIFTADIHLGITSSMAWDAEVMKMKKEKADILVIGGDYRKPGYMVIEI